MNASQMMSVLNMRFAKTQMADLVVIVIKVSLTKVVFALILMNAHSDSTIAHQTRDVKTALVHTSVMKK